VSEDLTPQVGILHLSDLQFGRHNRFHDLPVPLADSIYSDLVSIQMDKHIHFLVVTGDIAEIASQTEFKEAKAFLLDLIKRLGIPTERLLVVPGNHDVNWDLCRAHFLDCSARDRIPSAPFEPKYEFYREFLRELHGKDVGPNFGVRDFQEFDLAFGLLDSTHSETHEQHFGECGYQQYASIAEALKASKAHTRILLVHHNVRRKCVDDSENLRDETLLTKYCGPFTDLVLHGHTHDGQRDYLPDGTLVLSTGSAAVANDARPEDVPNQYQVLVLKESEVTRTARLFKNIAWYADGSVGSGSGVETVGLKKSPSSAAQLSKPFDIAPDLPFPVPGRPFLEATVVGAEWDPARVSDYRTQIRDEISLRHPSSLTPIEFLRRLGLSQGNDLTRAGVLLFAHNPIVHVPACGMQCARYYGISKSADKHTFLLEGTVPDLIRDALAFVTSNIDRREETGVALDGRARVQYRYSMKALREILANALIHRDYADSARTASLAIFEDRIEIWSPGVWFSGSVPPQESALADHFRGSVKRNPTLARALSYIRLFEGEGSGLQVAVAESVDGGAKPPTVRQQDGFVIVTLFPFTYDVRAINEVTGAIAREVARERGLGFRSKRFMDNFVQPKLTSLPQNAGGPVVDGVVKPSALLVSGARVQLIVAEAGLGKSVMATWLQLRLCESGRLCLVVRCPDHSWSSSSPGLLIGKIIRESLETYDLVLEPIALEALLESHAITLILDEFDALSSGEASTFLSGLDDLLSRWRSLNVVLLGRPYPSVVQASDRLSAVEVWELLPWDKDQASRYAAVSSYGTMIPDSLLDVAAVGTGENQGYSPLVISAALSMRSRGSFTDSRWLLLEGFIGDVASRESARLDTQALSASSRRELLATLALSVFQSDFDQADLSSDFVWEVVERWLLDGHGELDGMHDAADVVRDLSRDPLLATRNSYSMGFAHRIFYEFFLAQSVVYGDVSESTVGALLEFLRRGEDEVFSLALEGFEALGNASRVVERLLHAGHGITDERLSVVRMLGAWANSNPKARPRRIQLLLDELRMEGRGGRRPDQELVRILMTAVGEKSLPDER